MNLEEMRKLYVEAAQKYYEDGEVIMSDEDFDILENNIRSLSPEDPILTSVGKGYELKGISDKEKFAHPLPMGSIEKEKDVDSLKKWIRSNTTWSTKIDGNSIACYYKNGNLWKVVTRGKDDIGIDRTAKFITCVSIPKKIPHLGYIRVRGEAAIRKSNYTAENGFDISKSSRNAVAGAISRQTDWEPVFKYVEFLAYDFRDCDTSEDLSGLDWTSFKVEEQKPVNIFLDMNIEEFKKKYKDEYEFDADGTVFKTGDELLAFKFEDEVAYTKLLNVEWTIGKDQRLTPVAILEPVQLAGATIERASLGSYNNAKAKGCDIVYSTHLVSIKRANEIIPYINKTYARSLEALSEGMPKCPVCGSTSVLNGEHAFCVNPNCGNIDASRLLTFCSYFYPEGMGDTVAQKILQAEGIQDVFQLLDLKKATKEVYGIGDSARSKFNEMLEKMSGDIDVKIVYNTFLSSCGDRAAEKIVDSGFNLNKLEIDLVEGEEYLNVTEVEKLDNIPNFNSNIVNDIKSKVDLFQKFLTKRTVIQKPSAKAVGTFCITGTRFKGEQLEIIAAAGWKEDSSIKKTTTVLVVKDPNSKSSKTQKATEYGIKIMSIEQFMEFIK